jgi:primosomal protein N' (replication factor Y) (superfamily II helicase)
MNSRQFAEVAINIEAALADSFHYQIPRDLIAQLQVGHLVEVEFGRRMAQGIVIGFTDTSPVEELKPIIAIIDPEPVVRPWQIELAQWLSRRYLAPLNACLRLMLPPGLTRWADSIYAINPRWDGTGRLTETQQAIVDLLRERGELRSNAIRRAVKGDWRMTTNQLVQRDILSRASVLDPPRARPKQVRVVELSAGQERIMMTVGQLGRASKAADVMVYLAGLPDPLPSEADVLSATGAKPANLRDLAEKSLISRFPAQQVVVPLAADNVPSEYAMVIGALPSSLETMPQRELLPELEAAGLVRIEQQPASVSLAIPRPSLANAILRLRGGEVYGHILDMLRREARAVPVGEVYMETGAAIRHLRRLADLELVRLSAKEIWRDSLADKDFTPSEPPELTLDQARVWGRIKLAMMDFDLGSHEVPAEDGDDLLEDDGDEVEVTDALNAAKPFLIHGVTGSGKTEIYMRAIDFALERGRRAIVLVPEIALTPQTVRRFAARFPGRVSVLHSALSDGERYDTWRRIRRGLVDIVIGPRSALFAPLPDLGVIVVDEEHDGSYKQTPPVPPPYYHAREAAIALAQFTGAVIILGSATPDVVTYHRAQGGRYHLLELPRRIMGHRQRIMGQAERLNLTARYQPVALPTVDVTSSEDILDLDDALTIPLPPIQVVDMRQELRAGNRTIFSRALESAIVETLERNEQAILFLNRRGSATFVNCRNCGHVMKCTRCGTPLTYHRSQLMLVCHQCGRREPNPQTCPNCRSDRIRFFGLGTERLAELVGERWPDARIIRWDRDTTIEQGSHEALLVGFINHEADILVGTQMIAKGLDLPFVTLVGVISADISLNLPDYNTGERAFQVLAQVAGRAGRGLLGGRVIMQTYQPYHYAIQAAADHDYAGFYVEEMEFRTQRALPPFRRIARLLVADPVEDKARRMAEAMAVQLRQNVREQALAATDIMGPTPAFFSRLDGRYRWHILIHSPDPYRVLAGISFPRSWVIDIDPESTL